MFLWLKLLLALCALKLCESAVLNIIVVSSEDIVDEHESNGNFSYHYIKAECNRTRAVTELRRVLNGSSVLVDAACSDVSQELVHISFYESLLMVSATGNVFQDYPEHFNVVPSSSGLPNALATLLKEYNWTTVIVINEVAEEYLKRSFMLQETLGSIMIDVASVNMNNFSTVMTTVFEHNSHIFIVNGGQTFALNLLCKSYVLQKYYPSYEWIFLDWYGYNWWSRYPDILASINCSQSSIDAILNYSLSLIPISDYKLNSQLELYNTLDAYTNDAISTLMLSYSNCIQNNSRTQQYCYDHLGNFIESISFEGQSGRVEFNKERNRISDSTAVVQYRSSLNFTIVGYVREGNFQNISPLWPNDEIPPDGTPIIVIDTLSTIVIVVNSTFITVEVIFMIICLLFNIILRNKKIVKLTSPVLNYIMIVGVAMMTISALPLQLRTFLSQLINCTIINRVLPVVGYDVCFGIVLVKTWRIYKIFKGDSVVGGKGLSDWKLIVVVLIIGAIDCIATLPLSIAAIVSNDATLVQDTTKGSTRNEYDVIENYYLIACNTSVFTILHIGFTVIFKIILHLAGFILAFLTRKVKVNVLNDFKSTTVIIYFATILQFLVYILIPLTMSNENLVTAVWGTLVFLMVTMFLGFSFIPKMIAVYKDPKGEHVFKQSYAPSTGANPSAVLNTAATTVEGTSPPV